jgi:general secretion pathway protein J
MTATASSAGPERRSLRRVAGLTLIELMVALAVVAVLGVVTYRAVAAASDSRQRLSAEYRRWSAITRFVQMVSTDLLEIAAQPPAPGTSPSLLFAPSSGDAGAEMSFLKVDGARASVRRIGYRLDGTRLLLLRWTGTDARTLPTQDVVLDQVGALHFAFFFQGNWTGTGPPTPAAASQLPAAIEMKLELADVGTIRRLIALR